MLPGTTPSSPVHAVGAADMATLDEVALARLGELDPGGRNGLVTRVLRTYALSLERLLAELAQARATGEHDVVRRVAHTLKSSSASVGASAFAELCARVEATARASDVDPQLLDALQAESDRVARAVQARLAA